MTYGKVRVIYSGIWREECGEETIVLFLVVVAIGPLKCFKEGNAD